MSKQRTDVSKYKSPSTGEYCTEPQYVAEVLCQRQAKKEKVGTLAYKFWNSGKWKNIYIRQISSANKLIKEFGDGVLIKFINSKEGRDIFSLGMRTIKEKISKFKNNISQDNISEASIVVRTNSYEPRKPFGEKTLFQKIKEIDNGKKD